MSNENFTRLKQSVIEAGQIMRGEIEPSREFTYEVEDEQARKKSEKVWAVCVSNEDEALTPFKLYEVRFSKSTVGLRDDNGESLVCPKNWFVPVHFAPEDEVVIEEFAQAA